MTWNSPNGVRAVQFSEASLFLLTHKAGGKDTLRVKAPKIKSYDKLHIKAAY